MYRPSQTPRLAVSSERITRGIAATTRERDGSDGCAPKRRRLPAGVRDGRRRTTADPRLIGPPRTRLARETRDARRVTPAHALRPTE
jgi:hypothetical protein